MRKKGEKVAVLASGGFDSNILIADALKHDNQVYPLYVRCGLIWEKAELYWLKKYLKALRNKRLQSLAVLSLAVTGSKAPEWATTGRGTPGYRSADRAVYLPARNRVLLRQAAVFCAERKIGKIAMGTLCSNPFADARQEFFLSFERTARRALGRKIKILTPFAKLHKRDLLSRARDLPIHLTFSCLNPRGLKPCGRCNKCAERDRLPFLSQ